MNIFEAGNFQWAIDELRACACSAEILSQMSSDHDDAQFTKRAKNAVATAKALLIKHRFSDAHLIAIRAEEELKFPKEYSAIRSEVLHVANSIKDEMEKRSFISVSPGRSSYIERPAYIGTNVLNAFPEAIPDIYEAGNCLGAECNTAAVFHLMRVVEWGLRALCTHLGLRRAKRGKGRTIAISYTDWETMLNQLPPLVDRKIERIKRGKAKQAAQEFYYPALQDIKAIRDAWRNHIMHSRAEYSSADAEAIFSHVKRLMGALAEGLPRNVKK